jgi:Cdc6-like AAA superfamily ATPase
MDKNRDPEIQQKIDSILEQFKMALPLEPSHLILRATELALKNFAERNIWVVPVTFESIFFNLIEFSKTQGVENESEEMRRSHLFINIFVNKYSKQYAQFYQYFVTDRENFIKQTIPGNNPPSLEIDQEALKLFDLAAHLAVEVFESKTIKGEHLIFSFFSPQFPGVQQYLQAIKVEKEKLLYEWVESLNLSYTELQRWESAFNFVQCKVDLVPLFSKMSEDWETPDEIIVEPDFPESESSAEPAAPPEADGIAQKSATPLVNLHVPKEELGRSPARGDQPTTLVKNDLLGRDHLVKALAEMIADEEQGTPFTIGLLGRWGSGKSTVMKMLQDVLKNRSDGSRFEFAEFNAWEYERTDNLEAGLAQEVVLSLVENLDAREKISVRVEFAVREHGQKVFRSLIYASLILIGIVLELVWIRSNLGEKNTQGLWINTLIGGGLAFGCIKFWDKFKKLYDHPLSVELRTYLKLPNYGEHLGLIPVLKRHIKSLCEIRLGTSAQRKERSRRLLGKWFRFFKEKDSESDSKLSRRLVVFIDDLDRCNPKSITKILDAVRLVMDVPNVIVIIGIDHRIALRAVGNSYAELADSDHSPQDIARDYLGKILQLAIVLNRPHSGQLKSFVNEGLFRDAKEQKSFPDKNQDENNNESFGNEPSPKAQEPDAQETEIKISENVQIDPNRKDSQRTTIIENSTEENEADNLWRKEIEFSTDESKLFFELIEVFELNNPRQLLRLRNSYGLLKLLHGMQGAIPEKPLYENMDPGEIKNKLMILLFWKEFEALHPKWAEQVKEPPKNSRREPIAAKIDDWLSKSDIGGVDFSFSGLTETAAFVERFVLPRAEGVRIKESGSQPAG